MTDQYTGDGGPAFPVPGLHNDADFNGMSMRDYFATHAALLAFRGEDGAIDAFCAKHIMGDIPAPSWSDDPIGNLMWWADAEARLRMLSADAMLRARKVAP